MKYSIIIPTYNRKFITLSVISNLYHLLKYRSDFEIIVVNDGSTDATDVLFLEMRAFLPNFKIVQTDKELGMYRNPGFARNAGAKKAEGEILCFCDGDIIHLNDPLKELDEFLINKDKDSNYFTGLHYRLFGTRLEGPRGESSDMPHGSWLAVSKNNFDEIGGYDERFQVYGNEDQDIVQRFRRKGLMHNILKTNIAVHPSFDGERDESLEIDSLKRLQMEYQRESSINRNAGEEWGKGVLLTEKVDFEIKQENADMKEKPISNNEIKSLFMQMKSIDASLSALVDQKILLNKVFSLVNNINQVTVSSVDTIFVAKQPVNGEKQVFDFIDNKVLDRVYSDFYDYKGNIKNMDSNSDLIILSQIHRQRNVGDYLDKAFESLKVGGQLVILCPYYSNCVGSGNTNSLWNAGYLIYNLIQAGFDCKNAKVSTFKNEIQVYLKKSKRIVPGNKSLDSLVDYFPFDVYQHFNGNILEANWK